MAYLLMLLTVSLAAGKVIHNYDNSFQYNIDAKSSDDEYRTYKKQNRYYAEEDDGRTSQYKDQYGSWYDNEDDYHPEKQNRDDYDDNNYEQRTLKAKSDFFYNFETDDNDLNRLENNANSFRKIKNKDPTPEQNPNNRKNGQGNGEKDKVSQLSTEEQTVSRTDEKAELEKDKKGPTTALDKIIEVNEKADVNLLEGDIKVLPKKKKKNDNPNSKRNALRDKRTLWLNREVPYEFDNTITAEVKKVIMEAIGEFHSRTCLKFVPYSAQTHGESIRLSFIKGTGCWSFIGRLESSGKQEISIGEGCAAKGIIMHEMMHAIGFFHEQSRTDRDKYVEILWENIRPGAEGNFDKQDPQQISGLDLPYDYDGLMHYGERSFSKNGNLTIRALNRVSQKLGQSNGFSNTDLLQIKKLYACEDSQPGWSPWSSYSPCSDDCYKTRQRVCFHQDISQCKGADTTRLLQTTLKCSSEECKRDGHWGRWSAWSSCTAKCRYGTHNRTRLCNDPVPRFGKPCSGSNKQQKSCYNGPCNLGPNDCTFENDTCIWSNVAGPFQWTRRKYATPTQETGPFGDHTRQGEGYYIYMEASGTQLGAKASLVTKQLPATTATCLTFWYNMYGADMGSLTATLTTGGKSSTIATISGNQGNVWKERKIQFSASSTYTIKFTATVGSSALSDIAIDDVLIRPGSCSSEATQSPQTVQTTEETKTTKSVQTTEETKTTKSVQTTERLTPSTQVTTKPAPTTAVKGTTAGPNPGGNGGSQTGSAGTGGHGSMISGSIVLTITCAVILVSIFK